MSDPASPSNPGAEQHLLGGIFVNNTAYARVSTFLRAEHFSVPVHRRIYEAIGALIGRGLEANPVTLRTYFDGDEGLAAAGGVAYLGKLAASAIVVSNAEGYGQIVLEAFQRRALIESAEAMIAEARKPDAGVTALDLVDRAATALQAVSAHSAGAHGGSAGGPQPASVGAGESLRRSEAAYKGEGQIAGLSTGLPALDRRTGGLQRGEYVVIGGRTGHGKSAMANTLLLSAIANSYRAILFDLEMGRHRSARRLLAALTGISAQRQATGDLSQPDWRLLTDARQAIADSDIVIDDTRRLPVALLRQRALYMQRRSGLDLVIVDYLQRARGADKLDTRANNAELVSGALTDLAGDLDVPVVALAQLSRQVEARDDQRPMLSDLRESGAIEQDADNVWFLYRHEEYLRRREPQAKPGQDPMRADKEHADWSEAMSAAKGRAELILSKVRHAEPGMVRLEFDGARSLFIDPLGAQGGLF